MPGVPFDQFEIDPLLVERDEVEADKYLAVDNSIGDRQICSALDLDHKFDQ